MHLDARGWLAVGSLAMLGVGCWLAWPPLGLIVPGGLVFLLLCVGEIVSQLPRRESERPNQEEA